MMVVGWPVTGSGGPGAGTSMSCSTPILSVCALCANRSCSYEVTTVGSTFDEVPFKSSWPWGTCTIAIAFTGSWQTEQVVEVMATPLTVLVRPAALHTD